LVWNFLTKLFFSSLSLTLNHVTLVLLYHWNSYINILWHFLMYTFTSIIDLKLWQMFKYDRNSYAWSVIKLHKKAYWSLFFLEFFKSKQSCVLELERDFPVAKLQVLETMQKKLKFQIGKFLHDTHAWPKQYLDKNINI